MQSRLVVPSQCRPHGAGAVWVPACSTRQGPRSVLPAGHQSVCCHPRPWAGITRHRPACPVMVGWSGRAKGGAFQGAQQRAEPASSDGMRPEELRGSVSPGQSWRLLSQAASGLGRLPGLSGGPARKLGTGLSSVEATGAPQESSGGNQDWVSESLRLSGGMWLQQWKPEARAPAGRPCGVPEAWRCP